MIFAVHKHTKEHRVVPRPDVLSNADWRYIEADADGWIEWSGGECPLPYSHEVEVMTRNAATWYKKAGDKRWCCDGVASDIIAYRPILEPQAEQAKEWNGDGLPPVGAVCECSIDFDEEKGSSNWNKIEVLYADESTVVGRIIEGCHAPSFSNGFETVLYKFRPLRTDRERWIEAAHKACDHSSNLIDMYCSIYDAGLARLPE